MRGLSLLFIGFLGAALANEPKSQVTSFEFDSDTVRYKAKYLPQSFFRLEGGGLELEIKKKTCFLKEWENLSKGLENLGERVIRDTVPYPTKVIPGQASLMWKDKKLKVNFLSPTFQYLQKLPGEVSSLLIQEGIKCKAKGGGEL